MREETIVIEPSDDRFESKYDPKPPKHKLTSSQKNLLRLFSPKGVGKGLGKTLGFPQGSYYDETLKELVELEILESKGVLIHNCNMAFPDGTEYPLIGYRRIK